VSPHSSPLIALAAAVVLGACLPESSSKVSEPLPPGGKHVLFIGNSLTFTNDLPATLAAIAASANDTVRVAAVTGPNLALIDHATGSSNAVSAIRSQRWDYVILQQGPTQAGLCRDTLTLAAKLFDPYVRAAGGRTALLMTWPTAAGSNAFFEEVRVSYQFAAQSVKGVFFPAGEAWRSAWAVDKSLAFYSADGYHPSPLGTFVTALEIYGRVSGRDPRSLPAKAFANGSEFSLPEATIRLLQQAAFDANSRFALEPSGITDSRASVISTTGC
jgi:hypothetical protein